MKKTISLVLDDKTLELLDDEILRNPNVHNRSQMIRSVIEKQLMDEGRLFKEEKNHNQKQDMKQLQKEIAMVKQLVGSLVYNSISNVQTGENGEEISLSAVTQLPLIEDSIIYELLENKLPYQGR